MEGQAHGVTASVGPACGGVPGTVFHPQRNRQAQRAVIDGKLFVGGKAERLQLALGIVHLLQRKQFGGEELHPGRDQILLQRLVGVDVEAPADGGDQRERRLPIGARFHLRGLDPHLDDILRLGRALRGGGRGQRQSQRQRGQTSRGCLILRVSHGLTPALLSSSRSMLVRKVSMSVMPTCL